MVPPRRRAILLEQGAAYLTEVFDRTTDIPRQEVKSLVEQRVQSLTRAVDKVYDAIVITAKAISDEAGKLDQEALEVLLACAQDGAFVFLLLEQHETQKVPGASGLPERFVVLELDVQQITLQDFTGQLDHRGVRLQRVLTVLGYPDPFWPVVEAALREAQESTRPFVATSESAAFTNHRILLPIVADGEPKPGAAAVKLLLRHLIVTWRINVAETADVIQSGAILADFGTVRQRAASILESAAQVLVRLEPRLKAVRETVFDHRSGAVFFWPGVWRQLHQHQSPVVRLIVDFFNEHLPNYWESDRPCMKRILYTPTRILLRGEQYYVNMRNVSPFVRFKEMWDEMEALRSVAGRIGPDVSLEPFDEWKCMLGLLDQLRNIALQTFSFVHAAVPAFDDPLASRFREVWGDRRRRVHGFVWESIRAYYSCLLWRGEETVEAMRGAFATWDGVCDTLKDLCAEAKSAMENKRDSPGFRVLVRRWREGDHPGENLLTAARAADRLKEEKIASVHVVGIGWGGIELPLVYDYIAEKMQVGQSRRLHIARWSHYRAPREPVGWDHFPEHKGDGILLDDAPAAVFDDNTLTGLTLQRIRDELLLSGASRVYLFVTRYSGERRHAQMRMSGHGAVDPQVLLSHVDGYLFETAFARSWSLKEYENPIGVFSLGRRRILECIYNNSTVELYEREGF